MRTDEQGRRRGLGRPSLMVALVLLLGGAGYGAGAYVLAPSAEYQRIPPPQPDQSGVPTLPTDRSTAGAPQIEALNPSVPVHIDVPRLGIHADILAGGLNTDGSLAVPPENQADRASWYSGSPTPGTIGSSIILGHVDSRNLPRGRAAFYPLGAAKPGDEVDITRADGTVAVFTVDAATVVPKNGFPADAVYGARPTPELRLITCGGAFVNGDYTGNVVVFAHLTRSHPDV
ncbi:class F sortase [Kitasatospora sp. NPDC051914]|uniref:class F sortase n=1 Tax=Kitasatospora sp. NPDC051914 TaxID=3154945 RepID=UPI003437843C